MRGEGACWSCHLVNLWFWKRAAQAHYVYLILNSLVLGVENEIQTMYPYYTHCVFHVVHSANALEEMTAHSK